MGNELQIVRANKPENGELKIVKAKQEEIPLVETAQEVVPGDDLSGKNPNAPRNVIGEVAKQAVAPVAKVDAKPNKGKLVNDYVAHLDKADPEKAKELKERIYSSEGLAPNNPKVLQQKAKTIEEIFNADEAAMSSVQADNLYKEATKWQLSQKENELTKRQISVAPKLQKYTEVEQKIEALKAPLSLIKRDEKQNLLYSNEEELAVINKANEAIQERLNLIADPEIQKYMEDILQVDKERKAVEKIQADNSVRDNLGYLETAISNVKSTGAHLLSSIGAAFKGESVQSKLDVIESDKKIAAIKAKVAKGEISAYEGATQMKDEVGYFGILQKLANNTEADTWLYDVGDQIEKEQEQIAQLNALQRPGDGKLFTAFPNPNTGSETLDNIVRNAGALGSRDFWAYDVPQVATSAGLMMVPGAAAYALASSGIGAPTGLAALDIMINTIGASTAGAYVSRKIEGTMEGGGYLQEEYARLKGTINPVTKKEFTDAEIHAVVWPGYELIKRKNQGMMAMDALQFAIAFAPISKIMKLSSLSSLGKIASFAGKVGFEGYSERWEEDVQGLFIYQETLKNKGLLDKDAGTGYLWDDKFWKGYEEWSKTDEAALSKSLGMWGGILMGGGGAVIQGISDMNAEYNERKEWIDTFLTLTKNGNKTGLTNLQQKGVNNALAENAIRGTTEGMLTTIREQREKDRVTMSDEENAKADAKVLETTERIKAYQAAADPIRKLENLTKFEKKKLTIRTVQIQEQTAARDAHIAELQEKNALPQVVASVQSQYDNVINALNADIDDIIDKVNKGAKKKEAKKQRDKEFGDKNNQLFGLPTEAVDINETPEQRKQRELEVLAQKVDETTKAANKQRDNDLEDAYERTGYEPTAADVLSHAPDDYLTTLGMIENDEEVTEGAKAAAIGWAQRTKARLIERVNNPNEKEYSSKILKGALAHIDNDLAVLGIKPVVATDQGFTTTAIKPTEMPTEIAGLKVVKLDGVVAGEEVFEVEGERFLTRDGKELMKQKVEENKPADTAPGVNEISGNTEVVSEPVVPTVGKVDKAKAKEKADKKAKRDKEVQDELDKVNKNIDDAVHAANKRMGLQSTGPIQAIPELVKIAKGYFEKAAIVGKKGVYKANDFVDEFMANPKNKELIDRFKDNVEALKTKLRDAFHEMMRGATTEKNQATEWRIQNDKKFAKEKRQEAKNKERKRKKKEKAGKFFSELEGEDSVEMESKMFDFLTQSGMENISDEAITEDYKKLIKRLGDITKDFPADKKAKTHKQLLSQMRSLEKRQFSNPEIEDMLADNFSEDDNYIKEMYAAAFSNDKQQQQLDRLAEMWRERNENGEIIPLLDENGKPIADQVIYDTILKHAHAANKEKDPSDLALYYALIPGAIGRQLAKQKNSDLITFHNNFKSTTRQKIIHLSNQGYNKESKTKSFLDILDSNGKHTDRELSNELIAQAYENEAAIKDKFSQKINEKGVNSYVTKRETIRAEIKAVMNKVDLIRTNRKDHPTGSTERNAINAQSNEIYEKEIKPLAAKLELLTADFLAEVTGIEQELWRGAIKKDAYAQKLYGTAEKPGYGTNAKPVMQGFFIDIAKSMKEEEQGDMFFKLLAVGNGDIKSQIKSLVQANIENLREAELIRNFKTIEGKTKNADMFKSYIEYHAEELTDPTIQKQHKDNLWAKEFATEAPSIVDAEGVSFTYTKNGKFKKVSTNDNAYVGDTLMTALVAFQSGKFARKGFYQQIFEQQAAFSNKLFIEANKYSLSEATALLEKLGLMNEPTIATDIKYVEQQIRDFTRKANGLNTNLSPAMAKEFVYNFVLNKHFLDMYFQPEMNTKGQKNFGSYIEKVKRFQQGRGVQLNLDIMPETMNMAVFRDPMAFVEIGGKLTKKLQEITDGGYLIRESMGNTIEKASGTLANYNNSIKATYTHHDKNNTRTMIKGHGVVLTKELAETLDKYSGNNTMMRIYDYMNAHNVDILSFASSAKKFDKSMVNEMPWAKDSTVLSDKELPAPKMVDVHSKYFLIQQDLRQEGKFKEAGLTRQQFYYAQIFNSFPQIQEKFNDIIGRKFEDFQRDFINKDEDTQKEFLRKMLNSKSDKYDFLRRYLAKEDATLNNTYFQDQIQNLLTGYVANKVMKLDSFKNIATEFPLIGNALKPMRIEDGEIKPGEAFVPADYAQHHKEGDVVFITRVPSTWNHSLTPVKIMGFLPKSAGNILITDAGTQKLSGADNDGDQRHVWSKYPKDGITQDQQDMNDVFDLMMEEYTGKGLDQEELQERFADVSEPIDTKANEDMLKPHEARMNKSASRYSIESQMKQIEANQDGQKTIAIGARFQAAFSLLDTFEGGLHVPVKIPAFGIDEKGNPVKGQDKTFTLGEFRAPTWKQRHDIKRILANFLNHSTDNPTLGKLGPMGINSETASLAYMLVSLGMDEESVYNYLNHPTVMEYARMSKEFSRPSSKYNRKDVWQKLADSFFDKTGEESNPFWDNEAKWVDLYTNTNIDDAIGKTAEQKTQFLKQLKYLIGISNDIMELARIEKLTAEPIDSTFDYYRTLNSLQRFNNGDGKFAAPNLFNSNHLDNASKVGLRAFRDFGKQYYPVMSVAGDQLFKRLKSIAKLDWEIMSKSNQEKLENGMQDLFLVNALDITESKAVLAERAKKVYDGLPATNPLKKLLKWDADQNKLTVRVDFQSFMNESQKEEYRGAFQELREKQFSSMVSNREEQAEFTEKEKGMNKEQLAKSRQERQDSKINKWETLLHHQLAEYGWNYSPKFGEFSSFMDLGTHLYVGERMASEFAAWNKEDDEMDRSSMAQVNTMIKQLQLSMPDLIPTVTVKKQKDGSVRVFNVKGDLIRNDTSGYVIADINGEKRIYNAQDLMADGVNASHVSASSAYEMFPTDDFVDPTTTTKSTVTAPAATAPAIQNNGVVTVSPERISDEAFERIEKGATAIVTRPGTKGLKLHNIIKQNNTNVKSPIHLIGQTLTLLNKDKAIEVKVKDAIQITSTLRAQLLTGGNDKNYYLALKKALAKELGITEQELVHQNNTDEWIITFESKKQSSSEQENIAEKQADKNPVMEQNFFNGYRPNSDLSKVHHFRPEIIKQFGANASTMDLVKAGIRTRTTRSKSWMTNEGKNLKVGDYIWQTDKKGSKVLTQITAIYPNTKDTWHKEGWIDSNFEFIKDYPTAIEFQLVSNKQEATNEVVPLDSTSPVKAEYQGAIVYATSSMGKSTLAAKYPEHITDFDALLATAFNEQMALLRGANYMVATADNVGDKIYTSYSIPGFNQAQMYQEALNAARKEAESGKTVLMGSKKYMSNADYIFQSTDDAALGKKLVRHNEDKSKEAQEREIKRFREGKDGENEMINASGMPVVKTEGRIEDLIIDKPSETTFTAYQGFKNKPDNRKYNYWSLNKNEAIDYTGDLDVRPLVGGNKINKKPENVRERKIDITGFLIAREKSGKKTEEYRALEKEFMAQGNKYFDILDNDAKGLANQTKFFDFLAQKGYKGYSEVRGSDINQENPYIVTFDNTQNTEWENGDLFDKPQSKNTKKPDRFTPAKKFSKALSQKLNVPHSWVTLEQAKAIRKNSTPIGDNEAAFYYNGNVYLIAGRVDENTQIHEFIHPLTNSIYVNNRPLFDKLWGDLVSTKEGLAIVDEIMQTSPELFKDGDPSVRGMLEIMTTAVEYEYANQQKNKTKKTGLAKIVQDIVDAIKSIIQKMMPELNVKDFSLDTTLGDLAKLMADDRRVNLKVDRNAMAGEPATKKFFEAIWDAPFEALDREGNAANEMREDDADEVYEQMIEVIETYYGKPIVSTVDLKAKKAELMAQFLAQKRAGAAINVPAMVRKEMLKYQPISVKEIAEVIDNKIEGIDKDRQKYKAEFDEWAWEHNIHSKNEAIRKTNADLDKVIDINDFTRQFMGEALDAALHRQEYNEKIIDKQYAEYVEAQALLKEIRTAYPNENALYAAPLDDIYRYLRQLESYNEPYVWYVKQKLRRVYVSNWIHARLQSENNPNLTTREKRESGVAATYFFYQMMENALWKRDVPDIGFWEKWITSPLLMSDNAVQFINHQNMEMKNTAVNHWSLATPAMLDAWHKIESMGIDPSVMITKAKSGITGEEQEVFIHDPIETRFTTKEKKAENRIMRIRLAQLERKAGSPEKAQAVLDFLKIHFANMEKYSPYSKYDMRFYKVPQIKGDFMEIFNMSGIEGVVLKDMESDPYLDDIVIDTNEGDRNVKDGALQLTLAQARRIVIAKYLGKSSSGEKYSAATAATKNAIYTKRAKEILANAGESPYRVSLNAAGEIVVAPTENVGSGAPFAPTKYRSQNIGAILSQYYLGLFYKNAIESNMPAIMFARDWHNREKNPIATGNKNLANAVNDLVNYKILGIQRQELSGAVTMITGKVIQTFVIFNALGFNYAAQAGNLGAGLFAFYKDYGISGYTLAAKKIAEMILKDIVMGTVKLPVTIVKGIMAAGEKAEGDNYDPWDTTFIDFVVKETFKNTLKINNMIHNAGFINFQGNLGLSASARAVSKVEQIAFLPMQMAESIIQFPQILYHLSRKELNMFDDEGNLKPGEKGLSTGKIAKILEGLTRRNGPYTEHGKARYQYTTEFAWLTMLKNWQTTLFNDMFMESEIHGLKRKPWFASGALFIPKHIYRSARSYVDKSTGKQKDMEPITGAEYVAFTQFMRVMIATQFFMYILTAGFKDWWDDEDAKNESFIESFIKRFFRAAAQVYGISDQQSLASALLKNQTPVMTTKIYESLEFAGELINTVSGDSTAYYQNEKSIYGNKGDSKLIKQAADFVPFGSAIKQYRILTTAAERVKIQEEAELEKKRKAALKKNKLKPL